MRWPILKDKRLRAIALFFWGVTIFWGITSIHSGLAQPSQQGLGFQPAAVGVLTDPPSGDWSPTAIDLFQRGQIQYQQGQLTAAVRLWQQAAQQFLAQQDPLNQARTWNHLAIAYRDLGQWETALAFSNRAIATLTRTAASELELAQALTNKGEIELTTGRTEAALATWQSAESLYQKAGDVVGILGTQVNQAQALQTLGLYRQATILLGTVSDRLQTLPDSPLKASGFHTLGLALLRTGDLQRAKAALQSALAIWQHLNLDGSSTLMALANVAITEDPQMAIALYQQVATTTSDRLIKLQARLNQFSLLVRRDQTADITPLVTPLIAEIQTLLGVLPPSRPVVYAQVNFTESLIRWQWGNLERLTGEPQELHQIAFSERAIAQLLANVVQQARQLEDTRAEAYALGQLGHLYEVTQQWRDARTLTEQAIQLTQPIQADDIAVSWQWQLGRILKQQGQTDAAIAAYSQAVEILYRLRGDLAATNPTIQFSFQEEVEPIYRQLVQLLLMNDEVANQPTQAHLQQARQVIESLKLAELNNFFREACLDLNPQQLDQIDPQAAVFYSIILPDRLAVIVSRAGAPLDYYATLLTNAQGGAKAAVKQVYEDLLATLNPYLINSNVLRPHQQLYDWLIRPAEATLKQNHIKTLVFVLDGVLNGVPIAALHDGHQYLIEHYQVALTPGLQLLPSRSLSAKQLSALVGGLSESRQGFAPLPNVRQEINEIATNVPASILFNQQFTGNQLNNRIATTSFPIVHLATHGQFSSQADRTFLLTWDGRIYVRELAQLLRYRERRDSPPIELLILSACQTAAGDERATLGLAGVALRSGARSTIATLWSVQDRSTTELMIHLYAALKQPDITKAEALRQSQLALLRSPGYRHPYYWAAFVLIGNWL
jgi:CHAT domain-containing protein/lipopolysaccharide biosynthesis regulator YciM